MTDDRVTMDSGEYVSTDELGELFSRRDAADLAIRRFAERWGVSKRSKIEEAAREWARVYAAGPPTAFRLHPASGAVIAAVHEADKPPKPETRGEVKIEGYTNAEHQGFQAFNSEYANRPQWSVRATMIVHEPTKPKKSDAERIAEALAYIAGLTRKLNNLGPLEKVESILRGGGD